MDILKSSVIRMEFLGQISDFSRPAKIEPVTKDFCLLKTAKAKLCMPAWDRLTDLFGTQS